ncbi:type I polyketide synthase [Corynebacterium sp. HS2168-gen11]|uniref:type I polyketide synthase n=1 Tax=Corynebacterium sp. HS2168-gen11 TaxID=2974027 RepID=UPI00216B0FA4|nr:type I polyketide synthase [Corynebacterium sp. HS2168-gen11]MCS4535295.1 DUF1729 domain-containing protein [Corynebacterium sp. HS2168-gen11]
MTDHRVKSEHITTASRLVTKLGTDNHKFAFVFSGQGLDWLSTLRASVSFGASATVARLVQEAAALLAPIQDELARSRPHGFDPLTWVQQPELGIDTTHASISVPGIVLSQLATLELLEAQGLDLERATTALGHSQGVWGVYAWQDLTQAAEILAMAQIVGVAVARHGRLTGLIRQGEHMPMISIDGITREHLTQAIATACANIAPEQRPVIGLQNGRKSFVIVGRPADNAEVMALLESEAAADLAAVKAKRKGGAPFAPTIQPLAVEVGFHHPLLQPGVEQAVAWAAQAGLNTDVMRAGATATMLTAEDWPTKVRAAVDADVRWFFDIGPYGGVVKLTESLLAGYGAATFAVCDANGQAKLFDAGQAPNLPQPYSNFAPVLEQRNGTVSVSTAFTRLTGRRPILLPGMTPTTVDPEIVAAAANAGYWAELAGGGQVTPEILAANLAKLEDLLDPGVNVQFNSMFLDPRLWKLQIGGKRLIPKARANGAPIDGIVITAGAPRHDDAIALVKQLRAEGFPWVAFKPGAVRHIQKNLAVAREIPEIPVILHVEGGKAGGHHSWEDLDELLIATYDEIRQHQNVVLCVGGGIGTPEIAADYITGSWSQRYGLPKMPVDGVLVGTAAMATLEAKTSSSVKQLLVETQAIEGWCGASSAVGGLSSGKSQLGADIYEIENSFAKAGRLLDEVAADAEAIEARKAEIIAAINKTAKPYFGELEEMTYQQWLQRYLELSGPTQGQWIDAAWYQRFSQMLARTEARLIAQDHGEFSPRITCSQTQDPAVAVDALVKLYPHAATDLLHPSDRAWFIDTLRTPGKPANFVPRIDQDVRRWWRADTLWQSQDERYDADQVAIIPGIAAIAGITTVNEPIAELFGRFDAALTQRLLAEGQIATPLDLDPATRVLNAPGTYWAGKNQPSLITRIGEPASWQAIPHGYTHVATGAKLLTEDAEHARLSVPLTGAEISGTQVALNIRFTTPLDAAAGTAPQVTAADAEAAMQELTLTAAGGVLGEYTDAGVQWETSLSAVEIAEYQAVTTGVLPTSSAAAQVAADVLVGKAWPAIFAAVQAAHIPGQHSASVIEGMLNLVHLEHQLQLHTALPQVGETPLPLTVTARVEDVRDTELGRIIAIAVDIYSANTLLAQLHERMAIRGRKGSQPAPTAVLPETLVATPRSFRARATVTAPLSMKPFALVTGDHNPIHLSPTAAALAGLPKGVIVHGMWTSAIAQLVATAGYQDDTVTTAHATLHEFHARMLQPVLPGSEIEFIVERIGLDTRENCGEVREINAYVAGELVFTATATLQAPRTFYAFPGQGIQSQNMGMDARAKSPAARAIWDRADAHTRAKLGFSIIEIVQHNPTQVVVAGESFTHPKGVLFLTQFTQVAMACLGVAQIAEMKEAHVLQKRAYFAGHSVGEYNALAAYASILTLENVIEIVYQRGLTMHRLVERDEHGNSNYGLAALRPHKMGLTAASVFDYVQRISAESGEFLEIVNYNLRGMQYAVAGTYKGLQQLAADAESRGPGQRACIIIPGIDVPFHSTRLLGGVDAFREHLDSLLPHEIALDVLVDRYIPNLVARPFSLSQEFVHAMLEVVDAPILREVLNTWDTQIQQPQRLARTLLVELLAWQFASPVRWIETQDLLLTSREQSGLGVQRFIEVGVGSAPTLANMMGQTLSLPEYAQVTIDVENLERDRGRVFATDQIAPPARSTHPEPIEQPDPEAPTQPAAPVTPTIESVVSQPAAGQVVAPLEFGPAAATAMLIALWTKVRPEQMSSTDSIETLVEGVSSRRNQLLLDLGVEFGLGAIDGAADAELRDLYATLTRMAKGYTPFGPVLTDAIADALRRLTGPVGKRPTYITEYLQQTWSLGAGWVEHVTAALVLGAREGASIRGGELATLQPAHPSSIAQLHELLDTAVAAVARDHGVEIHKAGGNTEHMGVVDSQALADFAAQVTGKTGVLAQTAHHILAALGLSPEPVVADTSAEQEAQQLYDTVAAELGADWPRQVAPRFDARQAVLLDDRWASVREDLARVAAGERHADELDITGSGEAAAKLAEYFELPHLAAQARNLAPLAYSDDIAVVTGASPDSIAAAVVAKLLHEGATVIATTSSLSHTRLGFYKDLYARHARGQAALWVVPANLSSFADVDALAQWIGETQTSTVNGQTKVEKPALKPTLLFPFAAPRVSGSLQDAGPAAESQMRLLLWSVERLIAKLSTIGIHTHVGQRLHVVLPGSPNRGRFGGDGAYGESKAALDALVTRWNAETSWQAHTSLVHMLIGWVRGTGLMGGNDPLVTAVEAAGVTTYSTDQMAAFVLANVEPQVRRQAAQQPVIVDVTGGLAEATLDLAALARQVSHSTPQLAAETPTTLQALPTPYRPIVETTPNFHDAVTVGLDEMVVIVGSGELGPLGSARTRFEVEISGKLSAAGVTELAWSMGLIRWESDPTPGWYDTNDAFIAEADIYDHFHDIVLQRIGIRQFHDDFEMVNNLAPELTTIYLDHDISFPVDDQATATSFVTSEPQHTTAHFDADSQEWIVTRKAGSAIHVPRRMAMTRVVGGQIPEGFDPAVYGIPADMIDNLDRVAVWNIVATVDAFLSSGFSPAELLGALHPARVASTQGTGLGGMQAMRSLYIDGLLAQPRQHDILQEALPNVIAAHVMQSYIGGYGQMIHPVAACATAAVSVEEAYDKIKLGKADFVVAGGFDDLSIEGITGFGDMAATADTTAMRAKGIDDRYVSRANDRRRGGFVEAAGGGTVLVTRASFALEMGLPVHGVIGFAESFADGAHTSIPAPGLGALGAACGGTHSRLVTQLRSVGVTPDEIAIISKHDTSTTANDPNESQLHERIATAIGRSSGNPLYVISQKTLTGHAKGGAAAFQIIGLTQVLRTGVIPGNKSLDCVDPVLAQHPHLVWLRNSLDLSSLPPKAGLVTSLGFGHVSALVAIVHPAAFAEAVRVAYGQARVEQWRRQAIEREAAGYRHILEGMHGTTALYQRPVDRNLGATGAAAQEREIAILVSEHTRLIDAVLEPNPDSSN